MERLYLMLEEIKEQNTEILKLLYRKQNVERIRDEGDYDLLTRQGIIDLDSRIAPNKQAFDMAYNEQKMLRQQMERKKDYSW